MDEQLAAAGFEHRSVKAVLVPIAHSPLHAAGVEDRWMTFDERTLREQFTSRW